MLKNKIIHKKINENKKHIYINKKQTNLPGWLSLGTRNYKSGHQSVSERHSTANGDEIKIKLATWITSGVLKVQI